MPCRGVIIEESLEDTAVLREVRIVDTKVEPVVDAHRTPWLRQWTLHTVEVPEAEAPRVAEHLSTAIDRAHAGSWYADFKNEARHFVIFRNRVFAIDRADPAQYAEAVRFGTALGIPEYQLDFAPQVEDWGR